MSIQSSINQMLSSITDRKLYENVYKSLKKTETNTGNIPSELNRLQKQIQRSNQLQATERYKQAIAAAMTQNQGAPQSTPDNAAEAPKAEDTPQTVVETPTYYAVEASPERQAQIDKLEKQFGNLQEAFNLADYGQTMYQSQETMDELIKENPDDWFGESLNQVAATRVNMQQNSARRTNENIAQRLQKAKAARSQSKQEFLKNKGGKHR